MVKVPEPSRLSRALSRSLCVRDTSILPRLAFCAGIEAGTGLAAFHHGLATTFPGNARFRFMAACTFATHPGDIIDYRVDTKSFHDPIMEGIGSFPHRSEQYYMHVDPAIRVLATTRFGDVVMPVVWTKRWGLGKVFYCALGHKPDDFDVPECRELIRRGLLWASR